MPASSSSGTGQAQAEASPAGSAPAAQFSGQRGDDARQALEEIRSAARAELQAKRAELDAAGAPRSFGEVIGETVRALVQGALGALADAYDGRPMDVLLGTPDEARAIRALIEQGDAEYALRELAERQPGDQRPSGEESLLHRLTFPPEAVEALSAKIKRLTEHRVAPGDERPLTGEPGERDADPPGFDYMTHPELRDWIEAWLPATHALVDVIAERQRGDELAALVRGDEPDSQAVARELPVEDQLVILASERRGFAAGDRGTYRHVEALRLRLRRRVEKLSVAVSE